MGPTHLSSKKWMKLNYAGGGLAIFLLLGTVVFVGYRSRKGILTKFHTWLKSMEKEEQEQIDTEAPEVAKEPSAPTEAPEQTEPEKADETTEQKQEPSSQEEESD